MKTQNIIFSVILVFFCNYASGDVVKKNDPDPKYLNLSVSVSSTNSIYKNIQMVSDETQIPICIAVTTSSLPQMEKVLTSANDIKNLNEFISILRRTKFKVRVFEAGIIVSTNDFEMSPDNPLDIELESFKYNGRQAGLIREVGKFFVGELQPALMESSSNQRSSKSVEIDISNSISIGEVLMISAGKSCAIWDMQINSDVLIHNAQDLLSLELSRITVMTYE